MKVYVLTVDSGSLSAAAAASGISATMAGNHLRMLEQRLGMRLLNRTTRHLARRGTPASPEELSGHECLAFSTAALAHWRLTGDDGEGGNLCVPVSGRVQVNNGQALRVAAVHGMGIVLQPEILLEEDVRAGRLVRLFPEHALPSRPMHLVYLQDRYRSPKLRSFVDFMSERFGA